MQIILTEEEYHELKNSPAEVERTKNKLDRKKYFDELAAFISAEIKFKVRTGDTIGYQSNYVRISDLNEAVTKARKKFVEVGESPVV